MKKWFLAILAITSVIGISAYWVINNVDIDNIVKRQIQSKGSDLTGQKVVVGSVDIKLSQGTGSIKNLKILSPRSHKYKNIFVLGEIKLDIDMSKIINSVKVINSIEASGISVFVYMDKNGEINIAKLEQQINKKLKKSKPKSQIKMVTTQKYDPNMIVKRVSLRNVEVHLDFTNINRKYYKVTLGQINIYNVGGEKGMPASKIGGIIINELNKKILYDIVAKQIIKKTIEKEIKRELNDVIKNLF